jgi:hypothetical protein
MPPVRPPPDADAGGLPALELVWLGVGGAVAPSCRHCRLCRRHLLDVAANPLMSYSPLSPSGSMRCLMRSLVIMGDALLVMVR